MGIAVFANDKLVGELNGIESLCHLLVVDKLKNATISSPNPFNLDSSISLYITASKAPKVSVDLINGTPYVKCNISINANILSLDKDLDYSNENNLKLIEEYANSYLEQKIASYFYKTAKDFNSDIANLGNFVIKNYATWEDWINSDWLYNYENSFFEVNVDTSVQSGQLFTKV